MMFSKHARKDLAELVRSIKGQSCCWTYTEAVSTGWSAIDMALRPGPLDGQAHTACGGLGRGAIHEWFGQPGCNEAAPGFVPGWRCPLCLLTHLAKRACSTGAAGQRSWVIWIGRSCWPYPGMLAQSGGQDGELLQRSLFVDPPDVASRLWAVDTAVRCRAVAAVIADGRQFNMAATRRLQLAAKSGEALTLLARGGDELGQLSAAATRWLVQPMVSADQRPRWKVQLLRCKGMQSLAHVEGQRVWPLGWDYEKGAVVVPAEVADRSASTPTTSRQTA